MVSPTGDVLSSLAMGSKSVGMRGKKKGFDLLERILQSPGSVSKQKNSGSYGKLLVLESSKALNALTAKIQYLGEGLVCPPKFIALLFGLNSIISATYISPMFN
jgi:hypothetical protein